MIEHHSAIPVYRQLAALLRDRIEAGKQADGTRVLSALPPGAPLPSESQLMGEYGISRDTARKAIRLLADEGLVIVVQGKGSFVKSG